MDIAADNDALFVRAHNAIMDAKRLVGINLDWQARILAEIDQMFLKAYPPEIGKSSIRRKIHEQRAPYQPFPFGGMRTN